MYNSLKPGKVAAPTAWRPYNKGAKTHSTLRGGQEVSQVSGISQQRKDADDPPSMPPFLQHNGTEQGSYRE